MKIIFKALLLIFFVSCNKTAKDNGIAVKEQKQSDVSKIEDTFPFSGAEKIEVLSYDVRNMWDTLNIGGLVKNKRLNIDIKQIKERVYLTDKLKNKLFNYLFIDNCGDGGSMANCFDPRHSVLFYNKNGEIIAYFEVCLDCATAEVSPPFNHNAVCYERIDGLEEIFKEAGIKYFGENE